MKKNAIFDCGITFWLGSNMKWLSLILTWCKNFWLKFLLFDPYIYQNSKILWVKVTLYVYYIIIIILMKN